MTTSEMRWPVIIVTAGLIAWLMVAADLMSPLRSLVAGYLLICPGMAFVRLLRLQDRWIEICLAIALSIAIDTLVAEVLVLLKIWSVSGAVSVIVSLSVVGVVLDIATRRHARVRSQR